MKTLLFLAFFLLAGCQSPKVNNQAWTKTCGQVGDANYCVYDSAPSVMQKPTVVFMHGLLDGVDVFSNPLATPSGSSYADWITGMPPMKIVVISYGRAWMLTGYGLRTKKPLTSTVDDFLAALVVISQRHDIGKPPYLLVGHSLGSYNAAKLCTAEPGLWSKCAFINGMFIKDSQDPWNLFSICPACLEVKPNFDSLKQWQSDRPSAHLSIAMPQVWMSGAKTDIYQLYPGITEFRDKIKAAGIAVTWSESTVDHYHWDWQGMMRWLLK